VTTTSKALGPTSFAPRRGLGRAVTVASALAAAVALLVGHAGPAAAQDKKKPASAQAGGKGAQKPKVDKPKVDKPKVDKPKKGEKKGDKKAKKGEKKGGGEHASAVPPPQAAPAPKVAAPAGPPLELKLALQKVTLENGLRVVMNVDHSAPTVAVAVTYDVGSRNEEKGKSGFAHLFEHMMFEGSANVPKGEHFKLVSSHGGTLNGTTSDDRTDFFENMPSNELALVLWLEADRMKSLDVSEENFENQRKVVEEEYRMRVSNAAYAPSGIRLQELVFQGYWPYEHSTIGSMADLDGAKLEWVKEFHTAYYAPNNAVLTISGDFEADDAMALVHRYFDAIPKHDVPAWKDSQLPDQTSQRTAVVRDANARSADVLYGWAIPAARTPDHDALDLAARVLADGESSRLYHTLVKDKSWCQEVSSGTEDHRGPDLFVLDARLAEGAKAGDVEKVVEDEIKALGNKGPTDAELEKAKRRAQSQLVLGLQSNLARARKLGEYEAFFGDAKLLGDELGRILAVTKDDVKRATAQYLAPARRTIVETYPPTGGEAAKPAAPKPQAAPPQAAPAPHDGGAKPHDKAHGDKGKKGSSDKGTKKPAGDKPKSKKKK
jgi:zinc protease